eukprot:CAMPEP_0175891096 /NCGR_PEP_ID=MMETSP0107_2-20121207/48197_1 /TAXON_ID=195067 ORGANISM="Goniomonas pacifica, Strain CCMP1869" /NCGR_SAMPLE_ID=MMETSP0107_2 /ASSEMBLY_ACC=CAM_ASM_000203 /LENGTH=307 /DNA_ID=CAMNT_0017211941 /DNA_START=141 /DNA_END=1064 /DNA_ORIENTATION=+
MGVISAKDGEGYPPWARDVAEFEDLSVGGLGPGCRVVPSPGLELSCIVNTQRLGGVRPSTLQESDPAGHSLGRSDHDDTATRSWMSGRSVSFGGVESKSFDSMSSVGSMSHESAGMDPRSADHSSPDRHCSRHRHSHTAKRTEPVRPRVTQRTSLHWSERSASLGSSPSPIARRVSSQSPPRSSPPLRRRHETSARVLANQPRQRSRAPVRRKEPIPTSPPRYWGAEEQARMSQSAKRRGAEALQKLRTLRERSQDAGRVHSTFSRAARVAFTDVRAKQARRSGVPGPGSYQVTRDVLGKQDNFDQG